MTTLHIPTLDTDRLILRAPTGDDAGPYADFYSSDHSSYVGGPLSEELAWRELAKEAGHWILRGYGRWSVVERSTGTWVGMTGLWFPKGWPEPEIGWVLAPAATGKGYATEAATAARTYAYETLGWTTVISLVATDNAPSAAVATRMGATPDGPFRHERYGDMTIYRHLGPDALDNDGSVEAYA